MQYRVAVFGVKDTTVEMIEFIEDICKVDVVISIDKDVLNKNHISGYSNLEKVTDERNITLFKSKKYSLSDDESTFFFESNDFDIGISFGWQRLIPERVIDKFKFGVFGFHGSCSYLPFGRGRSPLNWSLIKNDNRFINHLIKYDSGIDSPNVFDRVCFQINEHDTIRTLQYKNILTSKKMIKKLIDSYKNGIININFHSKDFNTFYRKRVPEDGKIEFIMRTSEIYNLVRAVTTPFPGAFAYVNEEKVIIWDAKPFDNIIDFSSFMPGEIIDEFDDYLIIRTIDGSMIVKEYSSDIKLVKGMILK